ncbi:MAG: hypothetical protein WBK88_05070 [Methanothrix sp.]
MLRTARLAVLQCIAEMWRQASVLVGEASRASIAGKSRRFETLEAALADMATRLRTAAREWRPHSEIARGAAQTTLARFY